MIYVAVGTQKFQFNRLLSMIDELIDKGEIKEEVFAQIGNSDYKPRNYEFETFLSKDEFEGYIEKCDLLITHGGVATIIAGLRRNKPVIVVPRLGKYGEHVDDHQLQIAESFCEQNFVIMCCDNDDLGKVVKQARKHTFSEYISHREMIIKTIREYLSNI